MGGKRVLALSGTVFHHLICLVGVKIHYHTSTTSALILRAKTLEEFVSHSATPLTSLRLSVFISHLTIKSYLADQYYLCRIRLQNGRIMARQSCLHLTSVGGLEEHS